MQWGCVVYCSGEKLYLIMQKFTPKIREIFQSSKPIHYKKGEMIIRPEYPNPYIFLLEDGFVRQYVISKEGKELTLNIFKTPSYIPFVLQLTREENNYYFEAINDVTVYPIKKTIFLKYIKNDRELLYDFVNRFSSAIVGLGKRLEYLLCESPYERLILFLIYVGRNLNDNPRQKVMQLTLTHYIIGTWIGLTRETVTKYMVQLKKKSLIGYKDRKLIIKSIKDLERELGVM